MQGISTHNAPFDELRDQHLAHPTLLPLFFLHHLLFENHASVGFIDIDLMDLLLIFCQMLLGSSQRFAIQCDMLLLTWLSVRSLHTREQGHQNRIDLFSIDGSQDVTVGGGTGKARSHPREHLLQPICPQSYPFCYGL
ncbi:hypothetical protein KSZ_02450 [Dictyobacter formicarum]|uniref:Tyr recombinase domain-containing protein n=1 Tax=Dictyobacter formicarum TaxID=2778368 RepID=A0ABQ3V8X5_9CHLR|nr:hypothetical protein [Dictyobacter formicarum]GHO82239.1 hypothetical protein KSZ_02450 [Dictyobacter formicarum]